MMLQIFLKFQGILYYSFVLEGAAFNKEGARKALSRTGGSLPEVL
jgi:hypothetical protein